MSSLLQQNKTSLQEILSTVNTLSNSSTQPSPVISVNASGLITATAGAKSSTYQLAFQPAKTITPGTTSQVVVSSGYFTGGAITVKGDTNLTPDNIKSGISIFGVNGDYAGSSANTNAFITRTLDSYTNSRITTIGSYAFAYCTKLQQVDCANVIYPRTTAFGGCSKLTTVSFPALQKIVNGCFVQCLSLVTASFPQVSVIMSSAFSKCTNLQSLYLTRPCICALTNSNAFASTPIGGYSASAGTYGSIYVPASLIASYQTATNWAYYSSRFATIENCSEWDGSYGDDELSYFSIENKSYYAVKKGMTWREWADSKYNIDSISTSVIARLAEEENDVSTLVDLDGVVQYTTGASTTHTYYLIEDSGANLITFTIDGIEYQAENGMTWAEWCDSDYNTIGGYLDGAEVWLPNDLWLDPERNDIPCLASDTIVGGGQYTSYFEDVFE